MSVLLPFSNLDNNELLLEVHYLPVSKSDDVYSLCQVLQCSHQMSAQKFETPKFLESKLSTNNFSMIHINIASLSKHIDELRGLLTVFNHLLILLESLKYGFMMIIL